MAATMPPKTGMMPMKTIWQERWDYKAKTGRDVTYVRGYPVIGRGVLHDWIPHAEVTARFERALRIPLWKRVKWFLQGKL